MSSDVANLSERGEEIKQIIPKLSLQIIPKKSLFANTDSSVFELCIWAGGDWDVGQDQSLLPPTPPPTRAQPLGLGISLQYPTDLTCYMILSNLLNFSKYSFFLI